jgi:hypothetical protein
MCKISHVSQITILIICIKVLLRSEKLDHTYLFADFLKLAIIDISSKIICKNNSIMLIFCAGRTVILRPSFAREATTANLSSLKSNLDINNETSSSILEHFSLFFQLAPNIFNLEPVNKVGG